MASCIAAYFFAGCDDAVNNAITDNKAYIKGAYEKKISNIYLESSDEERASVQMALSRRDDSRDVEVTVCASETALEEYNKKYGKDYKLYPENLWRFESEKIIFKKGTTGAPVNLLIKPVPDELIAEGSIYVIPVNIASVDGAGILNGAETLICIIRRTPVATVGGFLKTGVAQDLYLPVNHGETLYSYTELTIEFMIKLTEWTSAHNFALIYNQSGNQGQIYSRIEGGGNGLAKAAFEWNIGDGEAISAAPPSGKIELNKWYHVAFTFGKGQIAIYIDGISVARLDVARKAIVCGNGYIWRGAGCNGGYGSTPSRNSTMSAELRIWNVIRTQEQIQECMYAVNPKSQGLLGYWKMNDGSGNTVKDYAGTADGYTVTYNTTNPSSIGLTWYTGETLTVGQ